MIFDPNRMDSVEGMMVDNIPLSDMEWKPTAEIIKSIKSLLEMYDINLDDWEEE